MKKLLLLTAALAATTCVADTVTDNFKERLVAKFPHAAKAEIAPSALPGFYSVKNGREVVFFSENLNYLINGEVLDFGRNVSITEEVRGVEAPKPPHIVDLSLLVEKDAIHFGSGPQKLYVFSDPDCPWCRRVEAELVKLNNVHIVVFPFPIDQLHPNSRAAVKAIWCSKDRAAAWRNYLLPPVNGASITHIGDAKTSASKQNQKRAVAQKCETPTQRNVDLAEKLSISGTPALIFPNGLVVPGAIPADQIQARLNEATK
jgi:thiol:disulfide interchange protein DsbC